MAIDYTSEQVIPIRDAPSRYPGKRPNIATIYRHLLREEDPLESFRIAGRRFTSVEAIHRFIDRCNAQNTVTPTSASKRREGEIEQAERELASEGI